MDRLANHVFVLILSFLFVIEADSDTQLRIVIALTWGILFCFTAFFLKWLSLDGAIAALVIGTFTLGIGDYEALIMILAFFLSSIFVTRERSVHPGDMNITYFEKERRNGVQVWSNGFWFILMLIFAFIFESSVCYVAAAAALATATSDTWATELGSTRFNTETYLIHNFKRVKPGTDGGVSLYGTLGALGGSFFIGIVSYFLFSFVSWPTVFIISGAGFLGCIADSYLGATLQNREQGMPDLLPGRSFSFKADNNFVNWLATGIGSVAALIINLVMV